jgi:hypothetical protein
MTDLCIYAYPPFRLGGESATRLLEGSEGVMGIDHCFKSARKSRKPRSSICVAEGSFYPSRRRSFVFFYYFYYYFLLSVCPSAALLRAL